MKKKRLIVAYDKFTASPGQAESPDPNSDFLRILVESFRQKGWLKNAEDQFFYSLNTTIEVEFPEEVNEEERMAHAASVSLQLNKLANTKVTYGEMHGNANPDLNRALFYEKINWIIQGG